MLLTTKPRERDLRNVKQELLSKNIASTWQISRVPFRLWLFYLSRVMLHFFLIFQAVESERHRRSDELSNNSLKYVGRKSNYPLMIS